MIPVSAECTMSTRAPRPRRSATMRAMLFQLLKVETLDPPNFRTIQLAGEVTSGALRARPARRRRIHCVRVPLRSVYVRGF